MELMGEMRRFIYKTDNTKILERLSSLVDEKNLSRNDLILIVSTLELNFDADACFPNLEREKKGSSKNE